VNLNSFASNQTNVNNSVANALSGFTNQATANGSAFLNQTNINNSVANALSGFTNMVNAIGSTQITTLATATWSSNGVVNLNNFASNQTNINNFVANALSGFTNQVNAIGSTGVTSLAIATWASNGVVIASNSVVNLNSFASNQTNINNSVGSSLSGFTNQATANGSAFLNQTNINNSVASALSGFTNGVNAIGSTGITSLAIATWASNGVINASNGVVNLNNFASNQTNINNSVSSSLNGFTNQVNAIGSTGVTSLAIATWSSNAAINASNGVLNLNNFASNQTNINNAVGSSLSTHSNQITTISSALSGFTNNVNTIGTLATNAYIAATNGQTIITNHLAQTGIAAHANMATNAGAAGTGYWAMSNGVWTTFPIGGSSGGGVGLSNIVINGITGTQSGSGSNLISTVTLAASDVGAVGVSSLSSTYYITNTWTITNSSDYAFGPLAANKVYIEEILAYLSNTNELARSFRSSFALWRRPDRLADAMGHSEYTNRLWWAAPLSASSVAGATSNVVADASGVIVGQRYVITDGSNYEIKFCCSNNASTIFWCSTNKYAWASAAKISIVNAVGQFLYNADDSSSNLYCRTVFNANGTNTLTKIIRYTKFGN
jgi:hypothetical protein